MLQKEPLCRYCEAKGKIVEATVVDHIVPIRVRPDLRLVVKNLQPLCAPCHNRKTASEDGGFGHRKR